MSSVIEHHAIELRLSGRVQGVGFRPFVFQLAKAHHISGWICNTIGLVEIHAEGSAENLECFVAQLVEHAPPLSRPVIDRQWKAPVTGSSDFSIIASKNAGPAQIHIPPDSYLCCLCEQELYSEIDRRYHYPFINCTQCGPRYTIISGMPYDRANTSMEKFDLCDSCLQEYEDPGNRRFHAEPNACAECGPHLSFAGLAETVHGNSQLAIAATLSALQKGDIIAVKGVGGYHLVCDAANPRSIERLRRKKNRPHKPLALMVPAVGADLLDGVRALVDLENDEIAGALKSPERPVVLLKSKAGSSVAEAVAPGLDELGIMLPPSPLHLLLARQFGSALVVTSGNISGEPVITDDAEAATRLASVADGFLSHNRNIVRPADDSVIRPLAGFPRLLRVGRGYAPQEYPLPMKLPKPVLAVGGHQKNTVALAWDSRIVVSSHIGDLSSHRSMQVFEQVVEDLQRLYQVKAEVILCDRHPSYASTRWAKSQQAEVVSIQHHRAHASSLMGRESSAAQQSLVFVWDGAGYGDDGSIWGGEAFLGSPANWQRVASMRNFRLPGGEKAAQQPWRSAAALHWQLGLTYDRQHAAPMVYQAWQKDLNCYSTSSVGRLFDAVASMLDLTQISSHEGEAPMLLESLAEKIDTRDCLPFRRVQGMLEIDWAPLLREMCDGDKSKAYRASYFHRVMANTVVQVLLDIRKDRAVDNVGFSGGVFQNRLLGELILEQFKALDIEVIQPAGMPVNDGGLSYGQVMEYAASINGNPRNHHA